MKISIRTISALAIAFVAGNVYAWETGPSLYNPTYTTGTVYLASNGLNISSQPGYIGDIATLLSFEGSTNLVFYASNADFENNVWLKLDGNSAMAKTGGTVTINGGSNQRNVAGSINIWLDGYNYSGTTNINGSGGGAGHSVGSSTNVSSINIDISGGSTVSAVMAINSNGTVWGDANINISGDSTTAAITGAAGTLNGVLNISVGEGSSTAALSGVSTTGRARDVNITSIDASTTGAISGMTGGASVDGNIKISVLGIAAIGETPTTFAKVGGSVIGASVGNAASGGLSGDIVIDIKDVEMTSASASSAAITGSTVSTGSFSGKNISIDIDNITTVGAVSGSLNTGIGHTYLDGDVSITVKNSTTGSILGSSGATGSNTIGGALSINVSDSTIGAVTASTITTGSNTIVNGVTVDIKDSTVKGAVSGGAASITNGNVNVSIAEVNVGAAAYAITGSTGNISGSGDKGKVLLTVDHSDAAAVLGSSGSTANGVVVDVKNASTVKTITGSTGNILGGGVKVGIANSTATVVTGSSGNVVGDIEVNISNSMVTSVYGYYNNSATVENIVNGNITVNIDTASTVSTTLAAVFRSASARIDGNVEVNLIGMAGHNNFGDTFVGTVFGGYYDKDGVASYGSLNFINYVGDFKGKMGVNQFTSSYFGGFSYVTIDASSEVKLVSGNFTHYIDTIDIQGVLSTLQQKSGYSTTFLSNDGVIGTTLKGSGNIIINSDYAKSGLHFSGDTSDYTGDVYVQTGMLRVSELSRFSSSTIYLGTDASAIFSGNDGWISGLELSGDGTASFSGGNFTLNGSQAEFSGTWDIASNVYLLNNFNSTITVNGIGSLFLIGEKMVGGDTLTLNGNSSGVFGDGNITKVLVNSGSFAMGAYMDSAIVGDRTFDPSGSLGTTYALLAASIDGNLKVTATDTIGDVFGIWIANASAGKSVVNGDFTYERIGGYMSPKAHVIYGTNTEVNGNLNVYLENMDATNLALIAYDRGAADGSESNGPIVRGDMNVTFDGGTVTGYFYVGPNADNITSENLTSLARIEGDLNMIIGGKKLDEEFVASSTPTVITGTLNAMPTGSSIEGDLNLTLVSGTYSTILTGPASYYSGGVYYPENAILGGNAKVDILGGTYNGTIYVGSSLGYNGITKGNVELNIAKGTFNSDIYVGLSALQKLMGNKIEGDVSVNFGNLSEVIFKSGVTIHGDNVDSSTISFNSSNGDFGASIDGFDIMVLSSDSYVIFNAYNIKVDAGLIVFNVETLDIGAKLGFYGSTLISTEFEIILDAGFLASAGDFLELVDGVDFSMPDVNVSLVWDNGEIYDDLPWAFVAHGDVWGIEFIPEPNVYAAIFGLMVFVFAVQRRRRC